MSRMMPHAKLPLDHLGDPSQGPQGGGKTCRHRPSEQHLGQLLPRAIPSGGLADQDGAWRGGPPVLLSPNPLSIGTPTTAPHQRGGPPRALPCPVGADPPNAGAFPKLRHSLSVSYPHCIHSRPVRITKISKSGRRPTPLLLLRIRRGRDSTVGQRASFSPSQKSSTSLSRPTRECAGLAAEW